MVIYKRPTEDLNSGTTETNKFSKFSERVGLEPGTTGLRIQPADHSVTLPRIQLISRKVVGKSAHDNPERYCGWF